MKSPIVKLLLFLCFCCALAVNANAQLYRYTMLGSFDESFLSTAIAVGDQARLTFKLDGSKSDVWPSLDFGVFPNAITDLHFTLLPGAAGNYPGGSMTASSSAEIGDNQSGFADVFRFFLNPGSTPGLNFPHPSGNTFSQFDLMLQGGSTPFSLSHSTGDLLSTVMANQPLDLADFPNQYRMTLSASGGYASAYITSLVAVAVPEPAVITMAALMLSSLPNLRLARKSTRREQPC